MATKLIEIVRFREVPDKNHKHQRLYINYTIQYICLKVENNKWRTTTQKMQSDLPLKTLV